MLFLVVLQLPAAFYISRSTDYITYREKHHLTPHLGFFNKLICELASALVTLKMLVK